MLGGGQVSAGVPTQYEMARVRVPDDVCRPASPAVCNGHRPIGIGPTHRPGVLSELVRTPEIPAELMRVCMCVRVSVCVCFICCRDTLFFFFSKCYTTEKKIERNSNTDTEKWL